MPLCADPVVITVAVLLCRDSVHGESVAAFYNTPPSCKHGGENEAGSPTSTAFPECLFGVSQTKLQILDSCKSHVHSIALCMQERDFPTDAHSMETALSVCTHSVLNVDEWTCCKPFVDESSRILFSAACYSIACKFCQSVESKQMDILKQWIVDAHLPLKAPSSIIFCTGSHLFSMEVSILRSMDWRIGRVVYPSTSALLFLTGLMHRVPETCLAALGHLIVSTYVDLPGKDEPSSTEDQPQSTPVAHRTLFFLRRRHAASVALACLCATLLLAKEAVLHMSEESRVELLRMVAERLGIEDAYDDEDFLVCPGQYVSLFHYRSCPAC